ncbi:MAG: S41 family peptidase [Prevotella sp.]|nr:S41 family peptidase [Prevotella sp.]
MKRNIFWMVALLMMVSPLKAQKELDHNFEVAKNLEIFNALYRQLDMLYVDTLDANRMVGTGIRAMLQRLDPYTAYYPKASELKSFITGKYGGIGALIRYNLKQKTTVIDEPYENTPAQEAGLKKGDVILSIDDTTMVGKSVEYVREHLRGEAGTTFVLKIRRPSTNKVMQMKITRRTLSIMPTIPYYGMQGDGIGYICLTQFTEGCAQEVRRAFVDLKKQGMRSLVLDLRNNGGGSELEAAQLVNIFVPRGITIASNRGKLKRANRDYTTTVEPIDTLMPVVVLVNDDTASSSEITSGALQDLDRAVILGTRTYGKGLVQIPVDLPHNAQMKVTTSRYYIPSGRCIQAINYKQGDAAYQEHIPDSLTKVFHTAHGREVRDGGGITPDLVVKADSLPNIAYYLSASGRDSTETLFDYEVDYLAAHPTIAPASEFEITDADYEDFKQRAIANGFTYDPESNRAMKALKKIMEFEGYYEEARPEFEALEKKLQHDLAHDLDLHKETLKKVISADLIAAYYYQGGTVEYSLRHDKQMEAARELLRDEVRYRQLLRPQEP